MRYEHIELDLSTAALAELRQAMAPGMAAAFRGTPAPATLELITLFNEIEARLQRTDIDVQCPKNFDNMDLVS
jgi:hypothetical protein